jgi:large subunit ribosomal protein L1
MMSDNNVKEMMPLMLAVQKVKDDAKVKFDESIDIAVLLGVNVRRAEEQIRQSTVLPHGTGRKVKVAVFVGPDKLKEALDAGADAAGLEDLAEEIKKGPIDFQVVIATPSAMPVVGKLGQVLGPKGLMPNPKVGTVTANVAEAVKQVKSGLVVRYRTDKAGVVHCPMGRVSFEAKKIVENVEQFMTDLRKSKPAASKGKYIKKVVLSSTMGASMEIDLQSIEAII